MKKITSLLLIFAFVFGIGFMFNSQPAHAGWVNVYFRSDGTYVNGYYKTEPNYYKWDNYSWEGDWSDSLNDKSWYRDFGYDPGPFDNDVPNYDYWDSYNSYDSYDWNDYSYDYDWNDYS